MLSQEALDQTIGRISLMPFFPSSDPEARAVIMKEIASMASFDEQVLWLGYRIIQLYSKQWPGIAELRACFCKRFPPADGVQVESSIYFDQGFPSEAELGPIPHLRLEPAPSEVRAIAAAAQPRLLPDGQQFSADPELETLIHELAESARMPAAPIERRTKEEIERDLYSPRVTQADVDQAIQERKKAV